MGLFLSVVISYAGVNDAMECIRHILSGMVPDTEPDFQDLVEYYTTLLHKSTSLSSQPDWITECGQGYLCLTEDENGKLKSCAIKYYDGQPNSTAILFSTKISSFGQESVEDINTSNGDIKTERYIQTKTKTIIPQTTESINIGQSIRNRSPTPENISDPSRFSEGSFGRDNSDVEDTSEAKEKLTWHYRPLSPTPQSPLPEIHFQSYDGNTKESAYSEEYLRSLDGIKFRPLQRSDPSGRRRSFKKRNSSSSNSSRDSRASRDEELKIFTSLEEAEFDRVNNEQTGGFGSTPNLSAHSHSRSRSRENSKEGRNESWSVQASVDSNPDDNLDSSLKPKLKDLPKLGSFEEEKEEKKETDEVNEDLEEEIEDFWGNSDD